MRRYAKPIVIAESLTALHGPVTGSIKLPRHLSWTGSAIYELDDAARTVDYYRTVLNEACKPADLHDHLDRETLIKLWPSIWLPTDLRDAGERQFPELRPSAPETATG